MAEEITDLHEEEATIEELPEENPGEKEQLPEENLASETDLEPEKTEKSPATVENEQENSSEQSETTEDSPVERAGEEEKEEIKLIEAISYDTVNQILTEIHNNPDASPLPNDSSSYCSCIWSPDS